MPVGPGQIGIASAPGLWRAGDPAAGLSSDLDAIAAWGASAVVTLMERHELQALGIAAIGAGVHRRQMAWHHWPIPDYGAPGPAFMAAWTEGSAALRRALADGRRVLVHCRGGLGRSGTIVARLLVETGLDADAAIQAVRTTRPGAIETRLQEAWVRAGSASS